MSEFTRDEERAIPTSAHEKIMDYIIEVVGFGRKAKLAETTWNGK